MRSMVASGSAWRRLGFRAPHPVAPVRSTEQPVSSAVARSWETPPSSPELRKVQQLLSDVLASCPDPLFVVDDHGGIEQTNPAADALRARLGLGSAHQSGIKPVLDGVRLLASAASPPPFDLRSVESLQSLIRAEERLEEPVYDLRLTRRKSAGALTHGYIVQLVDLSPLLAALRGQDAANRHRDDILKLLSHDLRSPHAAILATLSHSDFATVPANLRQIIERAARRSLNMVDSLVRSVAESSDYQLEPVVLCHVLEEAVDSVWSRARENKVKVDFDPGQVESLVLADRGMITRAMTDVLDSLLKFSVTGQTITIELRTGLKDASAAVVCEFRATVRHISNGELARIFSRFSASHCGDVGSLGDSDGLQLVRTIVERHDGSVACGEYTGSLRVVTITLPRLDRCQDASLALG